MRKLRVAVIYGGRSGEHEISVASAASVIRALDRERYEPLPIRIEKDGRWVLADRPPVAASAAEVIEQARQSVARIGRATRDVILLAHPSDEALLTVERPQPTRRSIESDGRALMTGLAIDVVFPVLHGPYGEDGTVQGLLELANVAYVGPGVLASSVGMDKAVMRTVFAAHGLPLAPWVAMRATEWARERTGCLERICTLGFPVFVKPANLGSSVGISKVKREEELVAAVDQAFTFDRKVVVEQGVPDAREIECGVLGNDDPEASLPGEVIPAREFYDYEAKYLDAGSQTLTPADLTAAQTAEVQRCSLVAFRAIDAAGLSRVDFLLSRPTGTLFVNEINTMPGFTSISMYARMWEASGVEYPALVERLIHLALERHAAKQGLRTSIT